VIDGEKAQHVMVNRRRRGSALLLAALPTGVSAVHLASRYAVPATAQSGRTFPL
jgi:hypothetical protein